VNIEQLINNSIFCATTRIYALLAVLCEGHEISYINIKEIMDTLELAENTVRSAISKLINHNLIEMSDKKRAFIIK